MLTVTGDRKRAVAEQAIRDGGSSILAIGRVLNSASVPTEIFWHR
jgi:6-phosphogluconolactonase